MHRPWQWSFHAAGQQTLKQSRTKQMMGMLAGEK